MKISTSKNLFTLIFSLLSGFSAFGQTAITITAADMPVPTEPYNLDRITGLVPNVLPETNAVWDYSTSFGNVPDVAAFNTEFIPFFTDAGVDVYRTMFKNLNPNFGYEIYQEFDFNANGIDDIAVDVVEQNNTLQPFTGNINDSIFIPAQSKIVSVPRRIVEFPFTANSAWSSSSRRVTDMVFNIPAFGLNYTPVQHAYTWVRHDSIVGWGKMRVYTPDGPSIDYDVLMDRISEHTVDSFYLNGVPAPVALLTAFGVAQGQKTEETYRYNFYRKGSFGYLASFYYETDETYTNVFNAFIATDGLETAPPSATVENISYATVLYPNPSAGSELNIKLMGGQFELGSYEVFDAMGRLVKQGQLQTIGSDVQVKMGVPLPSGNYYIQLKDKQLRSIVTQQFEVIN
jgi:hypothetical protein